MLRITRGSASTIRTTFMVDETAAAADGDVTVTIKRQGTAVATDTAVYEAASTSYAYTLGSEVTDTLGDFVAEWSGVFSGVSATVRDDYEVVGSRLVSVSEVRSLEDLSDTTIFPTESVQEAIVYAEDVVAEYCGTPFFERAEVETFHGKTKGPLLLAHVFPTSITAASDDNGAVDSSAWVLLDHGEIDTDTSTFSGPVEITYVHGLTPAPSEIRWAARTIARQYLLDLVDRIPDRALSVQSDFGQIQMATAGGRPDRPTSMPDVNAALNRHRHRF